MIDERALRSFWPVERDDKSRMGERKTDAERQQKSPGRSGRRPAHFLGQSGYFTVQLLKAGSIHRPWWHAYSSFTIHGSILVREALSGSASVMQYAGHTPPDELRRRARRYLSALP